MTLTPLLYPCMGIALLVGCSALTPLRSTAHFVEYSLAPNVKYEPGGEAYAQVLATLLPKAIKKVESAHYRAFRAPPEIFICVTLNCFAAYVKTPNLSAAVIANNRLFLTPKLFNEERARLPLLLAHELSHLHLGQQLGHYDAAIPIWFHEGLATYVADGGGAESVTDGGAQAAAEAGQYFYPQHRNSRHQRLYAHDLQVPIHVFYRQAKLFIAHLQQQNPSAFHNFLLALQDGEEFYFAFYEAYGTHLASAAEAYLPTLSTVPITK